MRGFASLVREERALTAASIWGDDDLPTRTWSGAVVNNSTSMQLLTVYGCVRFIADGIATLPLDNYRKSADTVVEVPLPRWLAPYPEFDRIAWLTQILTSLLIDGNVYLMRVRGADGMLTQLVPLDPTQVSVRTDKGRVVYTIAGKDYTSFEILHIPALMYPGALKGMSPVEAARQTLGGSMAVEEFADRFFGQGATMAGVIEVPGELPATGDGSAPGLAKQFMRRHSGKKNAHLPAVLQGGAKWVGTQVTNDQAQFLQTRQFTSAQIAALMFLIDPTEFGMSMDKGSSITYANLEQRNARKVTVTYLPWTVRLEKAFSALLPPNEYVKFNVNGLLRGDTKTRFETYEIASRINQAAAESGDAPLLLTAEMRSLEELPKLDVGQDVTEISDDARQLSVAEVVQKVYLGVDKVITSDEAREIVNKAGGALAVPGPTFIPPTPAPAAVVNNTLPAMNVDARSYTQVDGTTVTVDQPDITVNTPEVRNDIVVEPAAVAITVPSEQRTTVRTVNRDENGRIVGIVDEVS